MPDRTKYRLERSPIQPSHVVAKFRKPNNLQELRDLIFEIENETARPAEKIGMLWRNTNFWLEETKRGIYYVVAPQDTS